MLRLGIALLIAGLFAGCSAKRIDPIVLTYPTEVLRRLSAEAHAKDVGGIVTLPVQDTKSMEPLIRGGDLLVVKFTPFAPGLDGRVVACRPQWNPALFLVHRIVAHDSYGYLVEGDNVDAEHPENKWRVTRENFVGEIVGVYRLKG